MFYKFYTPLHSYYVESEILVDDEIILLKKILNEEFIKEQKINFEVGPKLNFKSPWCSNVLNILNNVGLKKIKRIEMSHYYKKRPKIDTTLESFYENITSFDIECVNLEIEIVKDIRLYNKKENLGFDEIDIEMYTNLFNKLGRFPTNVELYDLSQCNSEHSRHWLFSGKMKLDDDKEVVLFDLIKKPYLENPQNSIIAFKDNSSAIKGYSINLLYLKNGKYTLKKINSNITLTAETHNFPTGIAPFPGAATGTGGRIRDNMGIGRGGGVVAGICGYCVGGIDDDMFWDDGTNARKILIQASNGASDYGNKFGEPVILGFCRSFSFYEKCKIEWLKPIMFSAGIGYIYDKDLIKKNPREGMNVIRIGGPAYRIGLGGGSASSKCQDTKEDNMNAVQRGDPEMENKVYRVIRQCIEMEDNPIKSIHDQGAGGMANVTKEIVSPVGASINLDNVIIGDDTLSPLEIWNAEYQEQMTMLVDDEIIIRRLCKRENVPFSNVGTITNDNHIKVYSKNEKVVDLPLNNSIPQKKYDCKEAKTLKFKRKYFNNFPIKELFSLVSVGSKRFLTNKVDRSVTGLIVQQQCVGPFHTPISNYAIVAHSYHDITGTVTSVGEQPIKGLLSPEKMARLTVGEMLTNMIFAKITSLEDIKCSGNWMWPAKLEGENYRLYSAVKALSDILLELNIAIDGGKDSVSMYTKTDHELIKSPGSLVLTGYAPTDNFYERVTPNFKKIGSKIIYIDFGNNKCRMGGSSLSIGGECPDFDCDNFKFIFNTIQDMIVRGEILSGHDKGDGGLITTLVEMSISSNIGIKLDIQNKVNINDYFLNEELGLILEVPVNILTYNQLNYTLLGYTTEKDISIKYNNKNVFDESISTLRNQWESKSLELEKRQTNYYNVIAEEKYLQNIKIPKFNIPDSIKFNENKEYSSYNVAIIREEGSNGEREMANAFYMAGFETWDVHMNDIIECPFILKKFRGLVFVGGFSYSDVLGAGRGWSSTILYNEQVKKAFYEFKECNNTFSFGVCNGCQLMSQLGWVPCKNLLENASKRFESRYCTVKVNKTNSIMLKDMENLIFGIWCAHKEGRIEEVVDDIPLVYTDSDGNATENYPENPNGSVGGTAGICSEDGRHLAMMPHPERSNLDWQLPWKPGNIESNKFTPWQMMFENAYQWCKKIDSIN